MFQQQGAISMDISNTLQSWGSSMYSAASGAGSAVKGFADTAVQKGKLGFNTTVTLMKDNPKTTIVTGLALAAVAATAAYLAMNGVDSVNNSNTTAN